MSERTRKKTNANGIRDDEWIVVKRKLAEVKERLTQVQVKGEKKSKIEDMMEELVVQCENAMKIGKREDLPKRLITKLKEQKRERENRGWRKTSSPPQTADTATPTPSIVSASTSAMAGGMGEERRKEANEQSREKSNPKRQK